MKFEIPVHRWAARAGNLKTEADWRRWLAAPCELADTINVEHVAGVDPMKLRRVGRLGNAALAISKELLSDLPELQPLSVVTVSELGELDANDALIESVVSGAHVSPQRFAASVHNHILGEVCINLGLECRGGASTGACDGFEVGLVEALGEMESGCWVLVLIYEPRVGEHYEKCFGRRSVEHMLGLLLQPSADIRLLLEKTDTDDSHEPRQPHALRWLAFLTGDTPEMRGRDGWHWKHVAA